MNELRQFILGKVDRVQNNLAQTQEKIEEHRRMIAELDQQVQESAILLRNLQEWLGEIPPDVIVFSDDARKKEQPLEERGSAAPALTEEPTIKQLIREWIAPRYKFKGGQLVDAIHELKPLVSIFTIRSALHRLSKEGVVKRIGRDTYRNLLFKGGSSSNSERDDRISTSESRPQGQCALLAVGIMGRATPMEVYRFLMEYPQIGFQSDSEDPQKRLRHIIREDTKRYERLDSNTWQLTPQGIAEFTTLYTPIRHLLGVEPQIGLFTEEPNQELTPV